MKFPSDFFSRGGGLLVTGLALTACGNEAPVVRAGADAPAEVGETFTMSPTASDPDGDPVTYQWQMTGTPNGSQAMLNGANTSGASFTPDLVGEYTFSVTVSDGDATSNPDTLVVTARIGPNLIVTADDVVINPSMDEITLRPGEEVRLNVGQSTVAAGLTAVFAWAVAELPDGVQFEFGDTTSSTQAFSTNDMGTYKFSATVDDGDFSESAEVTVNVRNPPVASATVLNNRVVVGNEFTLNGSASTVGPGGTASYTWSIASAPGGSQATLSDNTAESPTFTPDQAGTYRFELVLNDGFFSDMATVTVEAVQ